MVGGEHDRSGEIPQMLAPFDTKMREDASERQNPRGL
jgi:hypothetical protein